MSFLSSLLGIKSKTSDIIDVLNQEDFKKALSNNPGLLIDVRTAREHLAGHIAKSKNIDIFNTSVFNKFFRDIEKNKPIYLYCRSGNRSQKAAYKLEKMGFKKVIDLKGGYSAWI